MHDAYTTEAPARRRGRRAAAPPPGPASRALAFARTVSAGFAGRPRAAGAALAGFLCSAATVVTVSALLFSATAAQFGWTAEARRPAGVGSTPVPAVIEPVSGPNAGPPPGDLGAGEREQAAKAAAESAESADPADPTDPTDPADPADPAE